MNPGSLSILTLLLLAGAVILGAFGAHALADLLGQQGKETWDTASSYHFVHALGALILIALDRRLSSRWIRVAVVLHLCGIVLFSGSLYLLAAFEWSWLGPVTPFGGLLFIAGWVCAAAGIKQALKT